MYMTGGSLKNVGRTVFLSSAAWGMSIFCVTSYHFLSHVARIPARVVGKGVRDVHSSRLLKSCHLGMIGSPLKAHSNPEMLTPSTLSDTV